ncbi:MAG: trypsin-like peptidase domain-containing protein, partial [Pirellulaceae bacterium]|nr:trypsin-like peptidase domain-containing protein [Pirellulaceae bacterium]
VTDGRSGFSGVIVSAEGAVLTAGHAIEPGRRYKIRLADGRVFSGKGVGLSERIDCALIQITDKGTWPFAEMGHSADLVENQPCIGISHPGRYTQKRGAMVRFGRIASPVLNKNGMFQSTCLMEPGDSGGPLFDLQGRVIGIHSRIDWSLLHNYEVPIDTFRACWDQLQKPKRFRAGDNFSGIPELGLSTRRGRDRRSVVVTTVKEGSLAEKSGLKVGQTIRKLGKMSIRSPEQLYEQYLYQTLRRPKGLDLSVDRESGRTKTVQIHLPASEAEETPAVVKGGNKDPQKPTAIAELADLPQQFTDLESSLDDSIVTIRSKIEGETKRALGVRILGNQYLLSKNSLVGDNPSLTLSDTTTLKGKVVYRSRTDDLVLISASFTNSEGIVLNDLSTALPLPPKGTLLLTPDPSGDGKVSVLGSNRFTSPLSQSRARMGVSLTEKEGAILLEVLEDGPAEAAGLKTGDQVLRIDKKKFSRTQEMINYIGTKYPFDTITAVVSRDGQKETVSVKLGFTPEPPSRHVADRFKGGKSLRRDGFSTVVCHDGAIESANCGSPVFDLSGNFVGLNIARHSRARTYFIPQNTLYRFYTEAISQN